MSDPQRQRVRRTRGPGQQAWMVRNGSREQVGADLFNDRLARGWVFENPDQRISYVATEAGSAALGLTTAGEYVARLQDATERGVRITPVSNSNRELLQAAVDQDNERWEARNFDSLGEIEGAAGVFTRNFADTLTFGGISLAMRRLADGGDVYDRMVQAGNQAHGVAAGAGMVTGLLAPALAGGAGALARGLTGLGARATAGATAGAVAEGATAALAQPAGFLSGAGRALRALGPSGISNVAGEQLTSMLVNRGVSQTGSTIAGFVAEGAIDGGLTAVTLANMENRDLSASQIFADAGLGGALGFGFGAISTGFSAVARRMASRTPGARLINESRLDPTGQADVASIDDAELARQIRDFRDGRATPTPEGVAAIVNRFRLSNRDAESQAAFDLISSPQGLRAINDYEARLPEVARRLADALDTTEAEAQKLLAQFQDMRHLDDSMFGQQQVHAGSLHRAILDQEYETIQRLRQRVGDVAGARQLDEISGRLDEARKGLRYEAGVEHPTMGWDRSREAARSARAAGASPPAAAPAAAADDIVTGGRGIRRVHTVPIPGRIGRGRQPGVDPTADTVLARPGVDPLADTVAAAGTRPGLVADPKIARANFERLVRLRNEVRGIAAELANADPAYAVAGKRLVDNLNGVVTKDSVWGEAARLQARIDAAVDGSGKGLANFKRSLGQRNLASGEREFSPERLVRELAATGGKDDDAYLALQQAQLSMKDLVEIGASRNLNSRALDNAYRVIKTELEQTDSLAYVRRLFNRELRKEVEGSGLGRVLAGASVPAVAATIGAVGGSLLGSSALLITPAYAVAHALLKPVSTIQRLASVGQSFKNFNGRYTGALNMVRRALQTTGRTMAKVGRPSTAYSVFASWKSFDDLQRQYEEVEKELSQFRGSPEALLTRLTQQSSGLAELDADLAAAFQLTTIKALEYLEANKPRPPRDPLGISRAVPPSASEMGDYVARVHAIDDPISVLADFASGRLTAAGVEALRYVHEPLYAAMSADLTALVTELGTVPYHARIQLATWFGVPDPTMDPSFLMRLQSNYAQTEQQVRATQAWSRRPTGLNQNFLDQQATRAVGYERR